MEKAIPKHRPAKNPASQKAKPSPSKNRFKFQNNNPKTGRRALARRVVVLKFVSIFCRTWLGFLAEPFFSWILAPCFLVSFLGSTVRRFFQTFSKHFKELMFQKAFFQKQLLGEDIIQKTASWRRHHPKTASWRRLHPKNNFLEKTSSKKRPLGEDISQKHGFP